MTEYLEGLHYKKGLLYIFIYILQCIVYYITPVLIAIYLNDTASLSSLYTFVYIFLGLNFFRVFLRILTNRYTKLYIDKIVFLVSNNVAKKVIKSPIKNLVDKGTGYINNIIKIYVDTSEKVFNDIIFYILDALIAIIVFIYASMTKSILLGLVFIITILITLFLYLFIQKRQEKYIDAFNKYESNYTKHYVDYILNLRTVKLIRLDDYVHTNLIQKTDDVFSSLKKIYNFEAIKDALMSFFTLIPIICGIYYGIYEFEQGLNGVATILFFVLVSNDLRPIVRFIGDISLHFSEYRVAKNNLDECISVMDTTTYIDNFDKIEIRNLKFKYPDTNFEIRVDNFVASKSQNVGIIGKSGQGKTTLLNILSKAIKTDNVYIDGKQTLDNISFGYVTQEAEMFNTTLRENLCLGKIVEEDFLFTLFKELNLDSWLSSLNHGLDSEIGEKGIKLSTGQKQRLNLIRAIIQDKDAYILDEPTSNLDSATELRVVEIINKYLGHKTLIIVTHREKVLDICSTIYTMENHTLTIN